jgi:pimeloyl-ACP methyl ester carboxylesterase
MIICPTAWLKQYWQTGSNPQDRSPIVASVRLSSITPTRMLLAAFGPAARTSYRETEARRDLRLKLAEALHDWFCDHSSWDATLPYLTQDRFTYIFGDLRGYGASREIEGTNTLDEAAGDAIAIANKLGWPQFSMIGHSMSGLIVQRIAQLAPDRIARIVAITPVSPAGMGLPQSAVDHFRAIAFAGDDQRFAALSPMWGTRLSETWIRFKLRRWRETVSPAAAAKYVDVPADRPLACIGGTVGHPVLKIRMPVSDLESRRRHADRKDRLRPFSDCEF